MWLLCGDQVGKERLSVALERSLYAKCVIDLVSISLGDAFLDLLEYLAEHGPIDRGIQRPQLVPAIGSRSCRTVPIGVAETVLRTPGSLETGEPRQRQRPSAIYRQAEGSARFI